MPRALFALPALLLLAPAVAAQDMPLSQILIDGEGWKKVGDHAAKPKPANPVAAIGDVTWDGKSPTAVVRSPDGGTVFVGFDVMRSVIAYRATEHGIVGSGAPYCSLRVGSKRGTTDVTGLTVDRDGRIYAATPLGVQVFDPTGRLCGLLHPPAGGRMDGLAFEGDHLTAWVGDVKYTRKLKTTGVK